jgi:hypothetical protein
MVRNQVKGNHVSILHRDIKSSESKQYDELDIFVRAKKDIVDYRTNVVWMKAREIAAIKEAHFSGEQFTIMTKDDSRHDISWFRLLDDFEIVNMQRVITKAVSTIVFWPKIKVYYKIHISWLKRSLIVFDDKKAYYDYCDKVNSNTEGYCYRENSIEFTRAEGRWRWHGGAYCSIPRIVEAMFEFQYPVTAEQVEYMESFIEMIADVLDVAEKDGWVAKEERNHQYSLPKGFIDDSYHKDGHSSNSNEEYKSLFLDESLVNSKTYLYLMKHANGLTKIGISKRPKIREKTLQAEDPMLELHYVTSSDRSTEKRLHDIFAEHRVRGEWFRLSDNHIEWIKFVCGNDISMKILDNDTCN